ncbi:MAG: PorP/SprF family type IX secretion system membrane protein [Bacteroidia bacterium]
MKRNRLILFFVLSGGLALGQDIHYSQFNNSPYNLNPAQTGLFDGDFRLASNFRSQWSVIPVPYRTFSIGGDDRLNTKMEKDAVAVGALINADKSGDSKFTTTQILLSGSYIKKLNKDSTHFLSVGIQPGITTKSFDVSALTFDNQYNGDSYDPNLGSGENFPKTRMTYFDMGAGLAYLYHKNHRVYANIGYSLLHFNRPKQSFFNNDEIRLDAKHCVSGIASIPVSGPVDILPTFMYQRQGKFQETVLGLFGKYQLKPIDGMPTAVSLGGFYRLKDAFVMSIGMDYKNFNVGLSYDVNTSKLIAATNHRGGFEISVIWIHRTVKPFIAKKRVCPIYM